LTNVTGELQFQITSDLLRPLAWPPGTPDAPVDGTTYHAYRARSFVGLETPTPTRSLASIFGGQRFLGQIDLGVSDLGTGNLTLSKFEEAFVSLITGATLDESTVSDWAQMGDNVNNPNLPAMGIMGSTKIRMDTGALSWAHIILPNVQIRPAPVSISIGDGQNPTNKTYELVPTLATRAITGRLFSATAMSLYNNEDVSYKIRYNSRLAVTTHIKDATMVSSGDSFILGYRPTSTATGSPNSFTDNGAAETPTSVTLATGAVAIAAGGSAGDILVAVYPTDFVAI
jgi:hypothetical protein